jgi:molecular chaperone GrpE
LAKKKETEKVVKEEENSGDETPAAGNDSEDQDASESKDPVKELEEKLQAAQEEGKESYDRFLRISAEFENFKKRSIREMEDFRKFANELLIKELLSVVDNLERAITSSDSNGNSGGNVVEGIDLVLKEILKILERFKVSQIDCVEKPFDPGFHQAVMREENNDYPENTVVKELQKGYLLHDRLLRPAMVAVSVAKSKDDNKQEDKEEIKQD